MSEPSSTDRTQIQSGVPADSRDLLPGLPVIAGYDLQPEIARGGMGVVYRARDLTFDREVAIKVMKPSMNAIDFNREARITAKLSHPGIPPVHAMGTLSDERPYLVMKLIQGETLDSVLKRRTEFITDRGRLLAAFEQVCQAVGYAHSQGIIHRDLKPSNIMVGAFGEVQVMDWGLAKMVANRIAGNWPPVVSDAHETTDTTKADTPRADLESVAGQVKGTPAYMAPEQARGDVVNSRTDVFSLGGILAMILTGHPPFEGTSVLDTIIRATRAELDDTFARLDSSGADADLLALCKNCLAPRADDRYADATELAQAMAEHIAEVENRLLRQVQRERDKLAVFEYGRTMQVAHQEWRDSNLVAMRALLDGADPTLRNWEWRYLNRLNDPSQITFKGHTDGLQSVAFSPDGSRIVSASSNETAKVWDAKTGTEMLTLEGHTGFVTSVAFSPDGSRIVTGSGDRTAKVWNAETGTALTRVGDVRYVTSRPAPVYPLTLIGHVSRVTSVAFSPDGRLIVTGSGDRTAKVWDVETGTETLTLEGHIGSVESVAFSTDGRQIVTGSKDATAKLWDAKTGIEMLSFKGHTGPVESVAFSADGSRVLTGSRDESAKAWDAKTGTVTLTLKGHTSTVASVMFSPDGNRIATGSWDETAKVWDAKTGTEKLNLLGHRQSVASVAFSPDGSRIVTGSWDGTAKVWDAETGIESLSLEGHTGSVESLAFSPDGRQIVTGSWDETAKVWDAETGTETFTLEGHTGSVESVAFSTDGRQIVTGSEDANAKLWDAKTGMEMLTFEGHTGPVESVAFSPDGNRIATGSYDQTVKVWDVKTGAEMFSLIGHMSKVLFVAFSPDGSRIFTGGVKTAKIWDATTGTETVTVTLKGHTESVESIALSPDGSRIATGSGDGTAKVWDAKTGTETLTLKGHTGPVESVAFSPDGSRIVTGSHDLTAKVWDAKTGAEVLTLKGKTDFISSVSFSPDGSRIVTGHKGDKCGSAKIWDSRPTFHEFFSKSEAK